MLNKKHFPAYLTEGNVIFLSPYTRLVDKELVDWYNLRVKKFFTMYPNFYENQKDGYNDEVLLAFLDEMRKIWKEIEHRKIPYTIIDNVYLQYTGQSDDTGLSNR